MKKIILSLSIITCVFTGVIIMSEVKTKGITGIWFMSDYKKMMSFLELDTKYPNYKYYFYCMEVSKDEKKAKIYFNEINDPIDVVIKHIKDFEFEMIYKNKSRNFTFEYDKRFNIFQYFWHFDDSRPYPRRGQYDGDDGMMFQYLAKERQWDNTISKCQRLVKEISENDEGEDCEDGCGVD